MLTASLERRDAYNRCSSHAVEAHVEASKPSSRRLLNRVADGNAFVRYFDRGRVIRLEAGAVMKDATRRVTLGDHDSPRRVVPHHYVREVAWVRRIDRGAPGCQQRQHDDAHARQFSFGLSGHESIIDRLQRNSSRAVKPRSGSAVPTCPMRAARAGPRARAAPTMQRCLLQLPAQGSALLFLTRAQLPIRAVV